MMQAAPLELPSREIPSAHAVMARAGEENFPVASRLLSPADRRHLLAIYGFARLADELGDSFQGDRLAALDWLEQELHRAYAGDARHPLLARLGATLLERELPSEPFVRLIDANRLDQRVHRYHSWEQLRAYCELSATPVGELVLRVFRCATPERIALSDEVCTALQLVEHLQDLGEDLRLGRAYLPAEELARFDCSHEQLFALVNAGDVDAGNGCGSLGALQSPGPWVDRPQARLREAIGFQVARARGLLTAGVPLAREVRGRHKLALAAFTAGGLAALEQLERDGFEVLAGARKASKARLLLHMARVLRESRS